MAYWLTEQDPGVLTETDKGVWVRPGKEDAARNLAVEDVVCVYEVFRSEESGRSGGAKAVVLLSEVTDRVKKREGEWTRVAKTKPLAEGKCPHDDLLEILDRKRIQSLGPMNSKLLEITDDQFEQIADYFHKYKTGRQVAEEEAADAYAGTPRTRGQGFVPKEIRDAIEQYSMGNAKDHFNGEGYLVDDRSKYKPYDLCCTKNGEDYFVEVKGTQGIGDEILLTRNEVRWAKAHHKNMILFLNYSLDVTRSSVGPKVTGGEIRIINRWKPEEDALSPIAFSYRLPPS